MNDELNVDMTESSVYERVYEYELLPKHMNFVLFFVFLFDWAGVGVSVIRRRKRNHSSITKLLNG